MLVRLGFAMVLGIALVLVQVWPERPASLLRWFLLLGVGGPLYVGAELLIYRAMTALSKSAKPPLTRVASVIALAIGGFAVACLAWWLIGWITRATAGSGP